MRSDEPTEPVSDDDGDTTRLGVPDVDARLAAWIEDRDLGRAVHVRKYAEGLPPQARDEFFELVACLDQFDAEVRGDARLPNILGGKFELIEQIGRGGFGRVWRAIDLQLNREVAIKVIESRDAEQWQRTVAHEARVLASMKRADIVQVHEIGRVDAERGYCVMELIEGRTLEDCVSERNGGGAAWWQRIATWGRDVARAVQAVHDAKVLHRDLKPSNIMVRADGQVVLVDFGLAGHPEAETQGLSGTCAYLPPEVIRKLCYASEPTADIYQLGLVLYELLTGHRAFESDFDHVLGRKHRDVKERDSSVPVPLQDICRRAMEADPQARYASAGAMAEDLDLYLRGYLPMATRDRVGRMSLAGARLGLWRHRRSLVAGAGLVLLAVLFAVFGLPREGVRVTAMSVANDGPLQGILLASHSACVYTLLAEFTAERFQPVRVRPVSFSVSDGLTSSPPRGLSSFGQVVKAGRHDIEFGGAVEWPEATQRHLGVYVFSAETIEQQQMLERAFAGMERHGNRDGWVDSDGALDHLGAGKFKSAGRLPLPAREVVFARSWMSDGICCSKFVWAARDR